jgi:hypothetical protein
LPDKLGLRHSARWLVAPWKEQLQLIAACAIHSGQIAIEDRPIVSARGQADRCVRWDLLIQALGNPEATMELRQLLINSDFALEKCDRELADQTASVFRTFAPKVIKQLYLAVCTNYIACIDQNQRVTGWGIFPTLSRANHSCAPNCEIQGTATGQLVLRAARAINQGESITWDYSSPNGMGNMNRTERRRYLKKIFAFTCQCDRCRSE